MQQQLGMINTTGPGGSVRYISDPSAPGGYRQETELDHQQQSIYDLGSAAQAGALRTAGNQIGRIDTALGDTLTPPELSESYASGGDISRSFDAGGPVRRSFDTGGDVTGTYGSGGPLSRTFNTGQAVQGQVGPTDFEAARNATIDSEFGRARSRLDPMWEQAQDKERTRLANQGLSENSSATITANDNFGRARNDAYDTALSSAVRAGNDEAGRMFDQSVQQGEFANRAAGQQYAQGEGSARFGNEAALSDEERNRAAATFGNAAVAQRYGQNAGAAGFENDATGQEFDRNMARATFGNTATAQEEGRNADRANFGNTVRQANFGNRAFARSQPISDFAALLGTGGTTAMPAAYSGPVAGVAPTDVLGSYALNSQEKQNAYNQRVAQANSKNQALASIIRGGMAAFA